MPEADKLTLLKHVKHQKYSFKCVQIFSLGTSQGQKSCLRTVFMQIYERVQPVSLISVSCSWVTLHNEINQILVQIQLNTVGIGFLEKMFQKLMYDFYL